MSALPSSNSPVAAGYVARTPPSVAAYRRARGVFPAGAAQTLGALRGATRFPGEEGEIA